MTKKKITSGGKEVTRNTNISEEDVENLRRLSSLGKTYEYISDEEKERYEALSAREIRKIIKVNGQREVGYLLQLRQDLSPKFLKAIHKKNRKISFFESVGSSPLRKNDLKNGRIEILANLAVHPKANKALLKKISKDKEPAVRLATTENPFLSLKARLGIYQDLVNNAGYGDKTLLLKTLYKRDMPVYLLNNGLRKLFQNANFVISKNRWGVSVQFEEEVYEDTDPEYPDYTNYENGYNKKHKAELEKYYLLRQRQENQYEFRKLLFGISYLDGISLGTVKVILESGHTLSIFLLHTNKNNPAEVFENLVEYRNYFGEDQDPFKVPYRDLVGLASNPSVPGWVLEKLTELALPDLSYKRRGSMYSEIGHELSGNPSTPLESLLTLHSLHNVEEFEKRSESDEYIPYEGELGGISLSMWRRVEEHPTFLKWKEENPNYQELLPPVIKCTCHGL